jgi:hypothetical protein
MLFLSTLNWLGNKYYYFYRGFFSQSALAARLSTKNYSPEEIQDETTAVLSECRLFRKKEKWEFRLRNGSKKNFIVS